MFNQRVISAVLALASIAGASPAVAQQPPTVGSISGRATDEARRPYADYSVQLRDAETAQIVSTMPLDAKGMFLFQNLALSRRFLVELYNTREKEMVCTEGPFPLAPNAAVRDDVNIDCGAAPAALWLLAAGAGAVAAVAVVTQSASE